MYIFKYTYNTYHAVTIEKLEKKKFLNSVCCFFL